MRSYANAVREVLPPDGSRRIHQKLGGPCDIVAVRAAARMKQAVPADHLCLRIGKHGKGVALGLAEFPRLIRGIDANRSDLDVTLVEIVQVLLKTP